MHICWSQWDQQKLVLVDVQLWCPWIPPLCILQCQLILALVYSSIPLIQPNNLSTGNVWNRWRTNFPMDIIQSFVWSDSGQFIICSKGASLPSLWGAEGTIGLSSSVIPLGIDYGLYGGSWNMSTFHLTGEHNFSRRNGEENDNNCWRKNTFGGLEETSLLCKFSMHFRLSCLNWGIFPDLCLFFPLQFQAFIEGFSDMLCLQIHIFWVLRLLYSMCILYIT